MSKQSEKMTVASRKSHAIENFKIAAGLATGEHFGWLFQDSDVYKWIESVGVILQSQSDAKLEAKADEVIVIIEQAQEDDGYLDTYFQLKFPKLKYHQLYFSHELYCAGHLIEAAIAYDKATGKDKLLQVAKRFVSNIAEHFGYGDNQIQGADGHQEIELALVKLYDYTKDESYLRLAQFFIDVRGKNPDFYREEVVANLADGLSDDNPTIDLEYLQAYTQPKHQKHAVGHAVRMLYMATGMAKIVARDFDAELYQACLDIWDDIVHRKMYVTGVGSTVHGEALLVLMICQMIPCTVKHVLRLLCFILLTSYFKFHQKQSISMSWSACFITAFCQGLLPMESISFMLIL